MTLIKTSVLSFIATLFKILNGLILNKLVAVYVGPSGVALLGQFQNFLASLNIISTAGFAQGLTKYLSEFIDDTEQCAAVFSTAIKLISLLLLPISIIVYFNSSAISETVLGNKDYELWIKGLSISLIPATFSALIIAALNGLHEVKKLTLATILSNTFGMILSLSLIPSIGAGGALAVLLLMPVFSLAVSSTLLFRHKNFSSYWLKPKIANENIKRLGKFTLMAVASAISVPVSHMLIRTYIGDNISDDAAGLWTGLWRISEAYLLVITMTLTVYYLPKLSNLKKTDEIKSEIAKGQKIILPLVLVSAVLLYILRDFVILILFDNKFLPISEIMLYQLIGDVLKISTWLYTYIILAKAQVKIFVATEIFFSFLFVLLSIYFINNEGLIGVTYAFSINYFIAFVFFYTWFVRSCKRGVFETNEPEKTSISQNNNA